MNGITPEQIEAFIYGSLTGLFIGCAIGAAFMYAQHAQAVNEYTLEALEEMRQHWRPHDDA